MPIFLDQINYSFILEKTPQRIISLVPSQTELLVDLGLEDKLVGITKFCIHPSNLKKSKTIVGGTKNFHFDKIKILNPDLIICNKEENYKEGVEYLQKNYPVWTSDIYTIDDTIQMIRALGEICNIEEKANKLSTKISFLKQELIEKNRSKSLKRATYFIWKDPWMVAGSNNFINEMLSLDGYVNIFNQSTYSRYPKISMDNLIKENPDAILLSSEPYPFKEKHVRYLKTQLPNTEIRLVDGEIYSWYGSRLVHSLNKLFK